MPVPELCKLQQSWTDLWTSKSICENWQLGENCELQHQGVCIQSCTLADFWKDLLSICILSMLGKISWKQILRGSFSESGFEVFLSLRFSLAKMKYLFYIKWWNFSECFWRQDLSNLFTLALYWVSVKIWSAERYFFFRIYTKEIEYSVTWSYSCNWKRERKGRRMWNLTCLGFSLWMLH